MAFFCGVEPLDRYLKEQAGQDAKKRVAAPYVLLAGEGHAQRIAGYYTLSSDTIRVDDLPQDIVKKLHLPRYPHVGATLVGRLARDVSFRGQGIGELLLVDALKMALTTSETIASAAAVVDAKDENAARFYSAFGFLPFPDAARRLFLPMRTIEQTFQAPAGAALGSKA